MNREKQIAIAAKLYDARRLLRAVITGYPTHIVEWMRLIDGLAAVTGDHLSAGLQVAQELSKQGRDASIAWVFAATVELIEPDSLTPKL